MAHDTRLGAEGYFVVTRVARTDEVLSEVNLAAMMSPGSRKGPCGTPPDLVSTHLLELGTGIGVDLVSIAGRNGIVRVGKELASDGGAEGASDERGVSGRGQVAGEATVDGETSFVVDGRDEQRFVDGGEGAGGVQGGGDQLAVVNGAHWLGLCSGSIKTEGSGCQAVLCVDDLIYSESFQACGIRRGARELRIEKRLQCLLCSGRQEAVVLKLRMRNHRTWLGIGYTYHGIRLHNSRLEQR